MPVCGGESSYAFPGMSERSIQWNLGRLRTFAAVAELGSLTKVAGVLALPQSAISKQIAHLEAECGGRLFHRTGRGMTLTELGDRVLPRVLHLLAQAQELSMEVSAAARVPHGDVRVGALPSLYLAVIVPLFAQMREQFPQVRLQIFEGSGGQIDQWISSGFVDVGLTFRYESLNTPECEHLVTVGSYLMGSPGSPLLRAEEVRFAQLDEVPLALPGAPSRVRLLLDQLAKREGISLRVVLEADSTQIQKAVAATDGVYAILPRHAAAAEIAAGKLRASRIVQPSMKRMIVMGLTVARPMLLATAEVARMVRSLFRDGVAGKMIVADLSCDD